MTLNSPKVSVDKSAEYIFNYLSDVKNFEALMPSSISKFELIDESTFLFALKGMPEIKLQKKETIPHEKIVLGAAGGKIEFSLTATIHSIAANKSDVQLDFDGDFNPMMAMMIKGPISKFIETLAENLPKAV